MNLGGSQTREHGEKQNHRPLTQPSNHGGHLSACGHAQAGGAHGEPIQHRDYREKTK